MSELTERIESIIQKYYGELWAKSLWAGMEYAVDHYAQLRDDILGVCLVMDDTYLDDEDSPDEARTLRNYIYYIKCDLEYDYQDLHTEISKVPFDHADREKLRESIDLMFSMKLDNAIKHLTTCYTLITGQMPIIMPNTYVNLAEGLKEELS